MRVGKNSDPRSGMEKSRIRDKHSGSATLLKRDNQQKDEIYQQFLFFWAIFALLDPDLDTVRIQ
jgi:hypothetical protein